ncbi:MAG: rRNA maturation RNAse YbeY [candidate division WOR-3 bacterium]|nr:rRNA maturation RNAse YbeY [candidate division WOR-3 bacterium]MCX7947222.1 rRNA maturation RNAse YbeY [candidate division WOR-3 bacterium]MDW8150277.1 rRNA maturation RNAse YbeY [candidate division WOR-3 bacterium]
MIEIFGKVNLKGYKKRLKAFLESVLKKEKKFKFRKIYIILTNNRVMKDLNKKFLFKNKTTDVLSFELGNIAEVYVNVDYAKKLGDFSFYTAFYSLHGVLHLLGYDHKLKLKEEEMHKKQELYIKLWKY